MAKQKETLASNIRNIADHPEWQAALATEARLKSQFAEAEKAIMAYEQNTEIRGACQLSDVAKLSQTLLAEARGEPIAELPQVVTHSELSRRVAALRDALENHHHEMNVLRGRIGQQIYLTAWAEEHNEMLTQIAHDVLVLKESIDREAALGEQMFAAGCLNAPQSRRWVNLSQCPQLRRTFHGLDVEKFSRDNADLLLQNNTPKG